MAPFECPLCGGSVEMRRSEPGTRAYRNMERLPVPSVELPVCSQCGEEWLDKEATERLHDALEGAYAKALHKRAEWALDLLQKAIPQRELERLLGLSVGYLSKLRAGKKTSASLTAALLLLAKDTSRIQELRELFDAPGWVFCAKHYKMPNEPSVETPSMQLPVPTAEFSVSAIPVVAVEANDNTEELVVRLEATAA